MALNFIIKKVTKQRQNATILKTAINIDRALEVEAKRQEELLLIEQEELPTDARNKGKKTKGRYALMLTYEQTRKLPKHVRATVQFNHLQRQVLIITWRKLTDKSRRPRTMRLLQEVFIRLSEDKRVRSIYAQHAFSFNSAKAKVEHADSKHRRCMPKERHSSCRIHATYMFDLLNCFIKNLSANPAMQPMYVDDLADIISIHQPLFHCGFNGDVFERLGELLVDMLVMDEFVQTCPEGRRAWMRLFAYLVDAMRAELERSSHQRRKCKYLAPLKANSRDIMQKQEQEECFKLIAEGRCSVRSQYEMVKSHSAIATLLATSAFATMTMNPNNPPSSQRCRLPLFQNDASTDEGYVSAKQRGDSFQDNEESVSALHIGSNMHNRLAPMQNERRRNFLRVPLSYSSTTQATTSSSEDQGYHMYREGSFEDLEHIDYRRRQLNLPLQSLDRNYIVLSLQSPTANIPRHDASFASPVQSPSTAQRNARLPDNERIKAKRRTLVRMKRQVQSEQMATPPPSDRTEHLLTKCHSLPQPGPLCPEKLGLHGRLLCACECVRMCEVSDG